MAITDNSFTAEEITAAVTANPALVAAIKTGLSGQKIEVLTETEKGTFVENERNAVRGQITNEIYSKLDADILAATGMAKTHTEEKTYDYYKRTHKAVTDKVTAAEAKVTSLEEKVRTNSGDQALKDQLKAAQDELKDIREVKIPEYDKKLFTKDVDLLVAPALAELKFKSDLPEILLKPAIEKAKADLIASAKTDAEGKIYFTDTEGKTALNGTNRASAKDLLSVTLKDVIDTGVQQPGSGTGAPGAGGTGKPTEVKNKDGNAITIPADIKSRVQLHDYLGGQGLSESSDGFIQLFESHGKDLPMQ